MCNRILTDSHLIEQWWNFTDIRNGHELTIKQGSSRSAARLVEEITMFPESGGKP